MCLICRIDKFLKKQVAKWRKCVFRHSIVCPHSDFTMLGSVHLVNKNVTLGKGVILYPGVCFFGDGPIVIGDNTAIGNNTIIFAHKNGGGVNIGSDCAIAANCYIIDSDHGIKSGTPIARQSFTTKKISIGNDVWLAAGVKVLKGARLSTGTVVGAQSVVLGTFPENAIVVGIPGKVVKFRSDN